MESEHTFYISLTRLAHQFRKQHPIGNGITLIPFPKDLEQEYRLFGHGYFKRHFGDLIIKEARKSYCLEYTRPHVEYKSAQEAIESLQDPIITFQIVMRILKPTEMGVKGIFFTPPVTEGLPFEFVDYRLFSFHPRMPDDQGEAIGEQHFKRFTEADIPDISFYFGRLMDLLKKDELHYRRLFNTLRFFDLGYRSISSDSRILYFTIAMEVLFKPLKGHLTHGIADRVSRFLIKSDGEEKKIFDRFLEIMELRARVIHGDMTYVDFLKPEKIALVHDLENYLRLSLQKIIQHDDLIEIFSQVPEREKYLK